jgi:hypothetical protein
MSTHKIDQETNDPTNQMQYSLRENILTKYLNK